jgi:hypothetical protein
MEQKQYASNSRTRRVEPEAEKAKPEKKKVEKVITGHATLRKRSLSRRFAETFVGDGESGGVWGYILHDILIPAAKSVVTDAVSGGIERTLYGDVRGRGQGARQSYGGGTQRTQYSALSTRSNMREEPRREMSRRGRATHDFAEIVLDRRVDAEEVLTLMYNMLEDYHLVTVADLYDMVDMPQSHVDRAWGWEELAGSGVVPVKGGYMINLPRPVELD